MGVNYRSLLKKGAVAAEGWPWSSGKTPLKDALCLDAQPCPLDVCTVRSPNNNFNNNGLTGKRYLPTSRQSMAETLPCMPRAPLWRDVEQLSTRCLQCDVRPSRRMNSRHPGDERAQNLGTQSNLAAAGAPSVAAYWRVCQLFACPPPQITDTGGIFAAKEREQPGFCKSCHVYRTAPKFPCPGRPPACIVVPRAWALVSPLPCKHVRKGDGPRPTHIKMPAQRRCRQDHLAWTSFLVRASVNHWLPRSNFDPPRRLTLGHPAFARADSTDPYDFVTISVDSDALST